MKRLRLRAGSVLVLMGIWLLSLTAAPGALASTSHRGQRLVRVDPKPALPMFTAVGDRLAPKRRLDLTVELTPTDADGLAEEAAAVSDPGSPEFRHYLSVSQFAARYGARRAAVTAVAADLRAQGLRVSSGGANDLFLNVTGDAAEVDRAFRTRLANVKLDNGRVAYTNLRAPTLPASIAADVRGVIGLDDLHPTQQDGAEVRAAEHGGSSDPDAPLRVPTRRARLTSGSGPQPCASASERSDDGEDGYTINEQASAYQLSSLYAAADYGAGQTVGILELQAYNPNDVTAYFDCYGIDPAVNQINVDGGPGAYNDDAATDGESAMDIEVVGGIAPQATIDVYEAGPSDTSWVPVLNAAVGADQAKVISSSIAICEPDASSAIRSSDEMLLQEAAAQGQSFYVASGDSGAESCSQLGESSQGWNDDVNVDEPGAQPYATDVGGTTLYTIDNGVNDYYELGAVPAESVWNDGTNDECNCGGHPYGAGGGSGGGLSANFGMPSYQSGAAASLGVINSESAGASVCDQSYCREVPDVSADADLETGYVTYAQTELGELGTWTTEGGTSAAAPLWAAYTALVDADPACEGRTVGFVNPALYQIASSAYAANFSDPTNPSPISGAANNNTLPQFGTDAGNLYQSFAGYDMATGLGTPIGGTLAQSLCDEAASTAYLVSVTNPGAQTTTTGTAVSLQIGGTDSGNAALSYGASGLPAGLSISSSGLITGTPTTAGSSTVTVTATDQYSDSGTATFTWNVNAPASPPAPASTQASTSTPTPTPTTSSSTVTPAPVTPAKTATATPEPTLTAAVLGGAATGKLKLTFTVTAGTGDVKSVKLRLPAGLALSKSDKTLAKSITVRAGSKAARFSLSGGGTISTIKVATGATKIQVTLSGPALVESSNLKTEIKKKKVRTLKLGVTVLDSGGATSLAAALKV